MRFLFLAAFLAISVSACATKYQSTNGYFEQLTGRNTATIVFHDIVVNGSVATNSTKTREFALRSAAKLTLSQGFDYFLVETNYDYREETGLVINCWSCYLPAGQTAKMSPTQLDITMFRGALPNETGYYDARFLAK